MTDAEKRAFYRGVKARAIWLRVSIAIGGLYDFWPLWVLIHDHGITVAWRQRERFRWTIR